jgi:hypothetical protein
MEYVDAVPIWACSLATAFLLWVAIEVGYRLGRWRHAVRVDEKNQPVGAMVASILGLLALVLGFTFSLSATRFESRRLAALDEANAIGTTYLRSQLLPGPDRDAAGDALREYVEVRLEGARSSDASALDAAIARSDELHQKLWTTAISASGKRDTPSTALFIESLNELIDLHSVRLYASLRSRIPLVIWGALLFLSLLAFLGVGYQCGLSATRRSPAMLGFVLAFSVALYLIADLDRPQAGLMRVGQQSIVDVRKMMQPPQTDPAGDRSD